MYYHDMPWLANMSIYVSEYGLNDCMHTQIFNIEGGRW